MEQKDSVTRKERLEKNINQLTMIENVRSCQKLEEGMKAVPEESSEFMVLLKP